MKKIKVLVVEDEIITADYICDILRFNSYETLEPALNYTEAVEQLNTNAPDIAILDIKLAGRKSGIDVGNFINENIHIPFLYLTSYGDSKTVQMVKNTFPSGFLTKPFKKEDIAPIIEIALVNFQKNRVSNQKKPDLEIVEKWKLLTEAEKKVVLKISENKTSKVIADELFVSLSTIKNHRHNICQKLDLPSSNNSLMNWVLMNKDSLQ